MFSRHEGRLQILNCRPALIEQCSHLITNSGITHMAFDLAAKIVVTLDKCGHLRAEIIKLGLDLLLSCIGCLNWNYNAWRHIPSLTSSSPQLTTTRLRLQCTRSGCLQSSSFDPRRRC